MSPSLGRWQRARSVRLLSAAAGDAADAAAVAAAREARKEEKAAPKEAQRAKKAVSAATTPAANAAAGAVHDKITPRTEGYSKWYQVHYWKLPRCSEDGFL